MEWKKLILLFIAIIFEFFGFIIGTFIFSSITGPSNIFSVIGGLLGVLFGIYFGFGMSADLIKNPNMS